MIPARDSAPTEYRVVATATPRGATLARVGGDAVMLDTSWAREPSGHPGPAELLASSFAACLLKNLARTHDLIGFEYERAEVEVVARRQDVPPRFVEISYAIRLCTQEPVRRVELAHANLRKFGTVYNTLASVCDVHGSVSVEPRGR